MAAKKKDRKKPHKKQLKSRAKPGKKPKGKDKKAEAKPKDEGRYKVEGPTKQATTFLQLLTYGEIVFQLVGKDGKITNEIALSEFIHQLDGNIEEEGKGAAISKKIKKGLEKIIKTRGDMIKDLLPRYREELIED